MKKLLEVLITGVVLSAVSFNSSADITSLRGAVSLDGESEMFDKRKLVKQKDGFERSYKIQPPMIPHDTEKDKITLQSNTCMKCHSKKNHEKENAPEIGESHYVDRDGNVLEKLSTRRYFCNQCHANQVDAPPLVDNEFVGFK
ncbi:MAG: nitrate reductase cytochrome c-type subunit; periplasmic nitrate reductase electron transfer subunit [Gammaproteobacteria bacterium]|nr:nitrate reductase cytochrome c-type subunit; periplasmic nitrate reductase electron transfer subunit [Gammaproteobacteria bacterium]